MDCSEQYFGAVAEMPRVYRRLLCDWKRDRDLGIDRDLCSAGACNSVRGLVVVFCSELRAAVSGAVSGDRALPKPLGDKTLSIGKTIGFVAKLPASLEIYFQET
jgi:hypothetical protein